MEILILIALTLAIATMLAFALWIIIRTAIYLYYEIIHSVRNFKRELKQFIWDMEWKIKMMKGR